MSLGYQNTTLTPTMKTGEAHNRLQTRIFVCHHGGNEPPGPRAATWRSRAAGFRDAGFGRGGHGPVRSCLARARAIRNCLKLRIKLPLLITVARTRCRPQGHKELGRMKREESSRLGRCLSVWCLTEPMRNGTREDWTRVQERRISRKWPRKANKEMVSPDVRICCLLTPRRMAVAHGVLFTRRRHG